MADVLAMSENAATLAQQIGEYLATQGSTAEMKAIGRGVSGSATSLLQEVGRRRTRRTIPRAAGSAASPITSALRDATSPITSALRDAASPITSALRDAASPMTSALRDATSGLSATNLELLKRAAAPTAQRLAAPVYSVPQPKGIFGRAIEAAKGALTPSTKEIQPKGPISIAQAFEGTPYVSSKKGGYRRSRRVRRKNFA